MHYKDVHTEKILLALNQLPMEMYQKLTMVSKFGANVDRLDNHPSIVLLSNVVGFYLELFSLVLLCTIFGKYMCALLLLLVFLCEGFFSLILVCILLQSYLSL